MRFSVERQVTDALPTESERRPKVGSGRTGDQCPILMSDSMKLGKLP
jgi:hypothetical protein